MAKETIHMTRDLYDEILVAVATKERERIIKLLESLKGTCDNDCDDCRPYADKNDHYLNEVIALIKGEN